MNLRMESLLGQYRQREPGVLQELFYQQQYPGIQQCYATLLDVFLCQRASVLDIRAGFGDIAVHLARKEYSVVALAQTQKMFDILCAQQSLGKSDVDVRLGDITQLDIPERFNVIIAHNGIGAVPVEQDCVKVFQHIHKYLMEYGVCVFDFFTAQAFSGPALQTVALSLGSPPYLRTARLQRNHRLLTQEKIALCDWHMQTEHYQEQAVSTMRLYAPDDIAAVLDKAGFSHPRFFDVSVREGTSTINELKDTSRLVVCVARKVSFEDNSNRFANEEE